MADAPDPGTGASDDADDSDDPDDPDDPDDATVVRTAAEAAEGLVLSRYRQSTVRDLDVTVSFEDGVLDVDVYLNVPPDADADHDPEVVADEAARAARDAVDDLFGE